MNVLTAAEEASVMKKKRCFWWFFPFNFLPFFFFLNQNHVFGKSLKSFTLFYFKIWLSGYFYSSILNLFKIILFFFIKMKTLFINWLIQLISQQSIRFLSEISDHTDETVLVIFIVCHSPRESTCSSLHPHLCMLRFSWASPIFWLESIFLSQRQHRSISGNGYTMRALEVSVWLWRLLISHPPIMCLIAHR